MRLKNLPITIYLFFISTMISFTGFFTDPKLFSLKSYDFKLYQLFTYTFAHANFYHYMSNMFALVLFGLVLEHIIGRKKFFLLILFSYISVTVLSFYFYPAVIGISGLVYAIISCLTVLRPNLIVFLGGMPVPLWIAVIFWLIMDIIGIFYPSNIANISHIAGFFVGVIFGFVFRGREEKEEKRDEIEEYEIEKWEEKWMI